MDANEPFNSDIPVPVAPLSYQPGIPTLSRTHDGKLSTLVASCSLKDPLALQHSTRPFPTSHNHGTKRIDYILISPGLLPAVLRSGSLSYYSLMHTDHRAYYLDLDSLVMFADPAYDIAPVSGQNLRLQVPRIVNKYIEVLLEQLEHHTLLEKVESLREASLSQTWMAQHTQIYQGVDRITTEAKYSSQYQWSPTLKASVQTLCGGQYSSNHRRGGHQEPSGGLH
jgi:hypothetical protein